MNGAILTAPVTIRSFLFGAGTGADTAEVVGRVISEHGVARSALHGVRHLSAGAVQSVDREIGTVVDGLLDLDLGDILVACWSKHRALTEAAIRTLVAPGSEEVVALATHRAAATYSPHVDLLVDGRKVTTIEFRLTVVLDATGLAAVVRGGDLVALRGGDCRATATLLLEGVRLAERQSSLRPDLVVRLDPSVSLVDRAAVS
ncbi:MAG TPA: hypothetical protein VFT31_13040 [Kribbella sp.]|nr:hypothetical protein [Kribbella sp.]